MMTIHEKKHAYTAAIKALPDEKRDPAHGGLEACVKEAVRLSQDEEMRHLTASINNVKAINQGIRDMQEGRFRYISLDDL